MTGAEAIQAVQRRYEASLTKWQTRLVALSLLDGQRLWPYLPDDAAVLLRAESLVQQDHLGGRTAIAQARAELAASRPAKRASYFVISDFLPAQPAAGNVINDAGEEE